MSVQIQTPDVSKDFGQDDFDPLATDDPSRIYADYDKLRSSCPLSRTSQYGGYWQFTRYEDVKAAAMDHCTFISGVKAVVPSDPRGLRRPPLNFDPPAHTPYRTALDRTLKQSRIKRLEAVLLFHAKNELAPMLAAGGGDVSGEFGARFPAWVETEWLNLEPHLAPLLAETAAAWVNAWRAQEKERVGFFSAKLYDIAQDLLASRRLNPRDPEEDPASSLLLEKDPNGDPLEDVHLIGALRQSLVVGMVAPPLIIGAICKHLSEDKELQQQLRSSPELIPAAVEEFIRLYTPYRGFARTVSKIVEMHGRTINPGEPITMTYASANRDPSVFPEPEKFILNRPNITAHLGFGKGRHRCAGMPLARLAIQVALRVLLENTVEFTINGELKYAKMPEMGLITCPISITV